MTVPRWRLLLLAWSAGLLLWSCGADGRYVVIGNARAPNASGTVEVDALEGGSTQVATHLEYLRPPSRIRDDLTAYVVWFVPQRGAAVWAGVLKYNSEQRTGDLAATSPFRHFTVMITAERSARPNAPGDQVIASEKIQLQ